MDPDSKTTMPSSSHIDNRNMSKYLWQKDIPKLLSNSLLLGIQHHQAEDSGAGMHASPNDVLLSILDHCVMRRDFPCNSSRNGFNHGHAKAHITSHTSDGEMHNSLDKKTMEMLQGALTQQEIQKEAEEGMDSIIKPKAYAAKSQSARMPASYTTRQFNQNPALEKHSQKDDRSTRPPSLPFNHCDGSDVMVTSACHPHGPCTFKSTSKDGTNPFGDRSLCLGEKHIDLFEAVKEQLQQKDLENQHVVQLLLMKPPELEDTRKMSKLRDVETQLLAEKLRREEKENKEMTVGFDGACQVLTGKLFTAKSSDDFAKQLRALLEKYERLKKRATAVKKQLLLELTAKKRALKTLEAAKRETEELSTKQALLQEQRDAALRDLSRCRKKLQSMEDDHKGIITQKRRLAEKSSGMKTEIGQLTDQLGKTQKENMRLTKMACSRELEKEMDVKNLQESKDMVRKLRTKLDECQRERESTLHQMEAMKRESKLIHNRQTVEILQLQAEHACCMERTDRLQRESESLAKLVSDLKRDKNILKEELEDVRWEKTKYEMLRQQDEERLREAVCLLERERDVLVAEMGDLRKDYFNLSDRITLRMGQMEQSDAPMRITDMSSIQKRKSSKVDKNTTRVVSSKDVIQHIRQKLEEEDGME